MAEDFSETNLLKDLKGRDARQELLAQIFMKHRHRLRAMVELRLDHRLQKRFDPSDVVQEAFLEASRRLDEYLRDPPMPLYFWLRRITSQKLLALWRYHLGAKARDARREVSLSGDRFLETSAMVLASRLVGSGTSPSQEALRAESRRKVQVALEGMNPLDREVLALRHFEKHSNIEISRILKIEESAASKRYYRALWKLEKILGKKSAGREKDAGD